MANIVNRVFWGIFLAKDGTGDHYQKLTQGGIVNAD